MSSMPIAQWIVTLGVVACVVLMAYGGSLICGREAGKGAKHGSSNALRPTRSTQVLRRENRGS